MLANKTYWIVLVSVSFLDTLRAPFFFFFLGMRERPGNRRFSADGDGEDAEGDGDLAGLGPNAPLSLLIFLLGASRRRIVQLVRRDGCCCWFFGLAKFASVGFTTAIIPYTHYCTRN